MFMLMMHALYMRVCIRKQGLTVFRDQQFSSDMGSATVNRIENVRGLR